MTQEPAKTSNELAGERTDLAVERTAMAATRTFMAWVRTGTALIGFGFTIYKFLQAAYLQAKSAGVEVALMRPQGPRRLGLVLLCLGTAAVVLGTMEYLETIKRLNKLSKTKLGLVKFAMTAGIVVGLLGLFLFVTILINKEVF